jgi:hypothetical protein
MNAASFAFGADGSFTYTNNGISTSDSFTYRATNGSTSSNVTTVSLAQNQAPVASNACLNTPRGMETSGFVSVTDEGGPLTYELLSDGSKGNVILDEATGQFTYTPCSAQGIPCTPAAPGAGFVGMDKFTFRAIDQFSQPSATAAVTVLIDGAVRIMPLGDSITSGTMIGATLTPPEPDRVGYRQALKTSLDTAGYPTDFVGGLNMGYNLFSDSQHEGHGGWRDEEIAWGRVGVSNSGIYNWLVQNPADIVLLHIGTNGLDPSGQADVRDILDELDRWESSPGGYPVQVLLARIIDQNPINPGVTTYNNNVQTMALDRVNNAANPAYPDQIVIVNQHSALAYPTDLADDVHPNATGYGKMGARWAEALQPLLPQCP